MGFLKIIDREDVNRVVIAISEVLFYWRLDVKHCLKISFEVQPSKNSTKTHY